VLYIELVSQPRQHGVRWRFKTRLLTSNMTRILCLRLRFNEFLSLQEINSRLPFLFDEFRCAVNNESETARKLGVGGAALHVLDDFRFKESA